MEAIKLMGSVTLLLALMSSVTYCCCRTGGVAPTTERPTKRPTPTERPTAEPVEVNSVEFSFFIFAADRLELRLNGSFEYLVRAKDLPIIYRTFGPAGYSNLVRANAIDAIKSSATRFSTREYVMDRDRIEMAHSQAVEDRLVGDCCPMWCDPPSDSCGVMDCIPRHSDECVSRGLGLVASVRNFRLVSVDIPDEVFNYLDLPRPQENGEGGE